MARFDSLPGNADRITIYNEAGKLFEAQAETNPQQYANKKNYNDAIWYLAEAAINQGFPSLRGFTQEAIAREMGDHISDMWRNNPRIPHYWD